MKKEWLPISSPPNAGIEDQQNFLDKTIKLAHIASVGSIVTHPEPASEEVEFIGRILDRRLAHPSPCQRLALGFNKAADPEYWLIGITTSPPGSIRFGRCAMPRFNSRTRRSSFGGILSAPGTKSEEKLARQEKERRDRKYDHKGDERAE
jgi:hypothetical protein